LSCLIWIAKKCEKNEAESPGRKVILEKSRSRPIKDRIPGATIFLGFQYDAADGGDKILIND